MFPLTTHLPSHHHTRIPPTFAIFTDYVFSSLTFVFPSIYM